jgi:hypothetical protein
MLRLEGTAQFADCARITVEVAAPQGERVERAVRQAWYEVGLPVPARVVPVGSPLSDPDGLEASCA